MTFETDFGRKPTCFHCWIHEYGRFGFLEKTFLAQVDLCKR